MFKKTNLNLQPVLNWNCKNQLFWDDRINLAVKSLPCSLLSRQFRATFTTKRSHLRQTKCQSELVSDFCFKILEIEGSIVVFAIEEPQRNETKLFIVRLITLKHSNVVGKSIVKSIA